MAKKITYLLGAGASANAIPIVGYMHERMKEMSRYFLDIMNKYTKEKDYTKIHNFDQDLYNCLGTLSTINDELTWLIKEAGNYYTIDTLAKKFYLTNDTKNLSRLKKALIIYFTLEQTLQIQTNEKRDYNFSKNVVDKRYGSFIAAITKKNYPISGNNPDGLAAQNLGFRISENIKILSWNYDMQFELCIQSMLTNTIIQHIKREFKILPNKESKNEVNNLIIDPNSFAMVKLNGDAMWNRSTILKVKNKYTIFDGKPQEENNELLLIDFLKEYPNNNIEKSIDDDEEAPLLSFNFAWENDNNYRDKYRGHSNNIRAAEFIAEETEVLVVIGYSFPIFNREIDSFIFQKMKKLEKIYIQDTNPDRIESTMRNSFSRLQEQKIIPKNPDPFQELRHNPNQEYINVYEVEIYKESYTDQFVIPYELN